jgi:hypothetical protein
VVRGRFLDGPFGDTLWYDPIEDESDDDQFADEDEAA